ncbi:cytochrome c3 family protein [Adlercreutzia sp. R25]|uniref:cytochrome c3 family protein n=1 Tax=Adlercreutzia shanghongiae TaxID=3111773 RepID=UPI002DBD5531|nr:cytochrome c3 family protein [Adlercreutzia sp. R25]MEC4272104.1 cytochrome c3 family protein [Adlercreutzia sp. R25]
MKTKKTIVTFMAMSVLATILAMNIGCSPQQTTISSNEDEALASTAASVDFSWTADSDCNMCHADQVSGFTDLRCAEGAPFDAAQCATCHNDEANLVKAHEGATADGKMPTKLKKTSISAETCLTCHENLTVVAERTADSTVLTDVKGTVVNPHALPSSENHDAIACADCHNMHDTTATPEKAQGVCLGCHHAGEYTCGTCHAE